MADDSAGFAEYLEDLVQGEGYWEGESVILPKNLCVAVLSLLQHLFEERHILPESLALPTTHLNNRIGAEVFEQGTESFGKN